MKRNRASIGLVAALVAMLSVSLSGCAAPSSNALVAGSSLTIGEPGNLASYNPYVQATDESAQSAADFAQLTRAGFYYHDASGALVANTDFGSVTRDSQGNVTYKLSGKAKWSDGQAVDAADLAVSWLAGTSKQLPGFGSSLVLGSLALSDKITLLPDGVTVHFTQPVPNWKTALPLTIPAHILGRLAASDSTLSPQAAEKTITDLVNGGQSSVKYTAASAAFNAAYSTTAPATADQSVSAGPYKVTALTPTSATLIADPGFTAGPKASVEKITFQFYSSPDELNNAIIAKKVDLAAPQPTSLYNLSQLADKAKAAGLNATTADSGKNEIILLNHGGDSVFNAATWKSNSKQVRAALQGALKFIPRAGIWTTLAGTPGISKTNSLVFSTGDSSYGSSVSQNGTSNYVFQDAETSAELWQAAGFGRTIPLRVLFDSASPRGQLEYNQFSRLGKLGGFEVVNQSTENVQQVLASGQWDLYIAPMARLGSNLDVLATVLGATSGFSNSDATAIISKLDGSSNLSSDAVSAKNLDQALIQSGYGLPLFQLDNLVVWSSKLANYSAKPGNSSVVWGYSNWSVSAKGN